ncbi:MAG: hypothetical protein ACI9VM_000753 [Candidatus Azotimanducaceae bacterium]|jgi:hypothetical protein
MDEQNNSTDSTQTTDTNAAAQKDTGSVTSTGSSKNLIIGVVIALLALGAYMFTQKDTADTESAVVQMDAGEIDPQSVVARVNGTELFGVDLSLQLSQIIQASGFPDATAVDSETLPIMKEQALDAIVNTELMVQAALAAGIVVSSEEVNAQFDEITTNVGGPEVVAERLAELDLSIDDFKENLSRDMLIGQYIETNAEPVEPGSTEEEVQNFYNEITAGQTENVPPLEDIRPQIEAQLDILKQQEVVNVMIGALREGAEVESLIQ